MPAATINKDVPVRLGTFISWSMTITSAVDKDADRGRHHYCIGDDKTKHAPMRITQEQFCQHPKCSMRGYRWHKGQENEAGEVVLLSKEEIDALLDPNARVALVISAHPLAQVMAATVPGESVYYLQPGPKAGSKEGYAVLSALLRQHTDMALVAVFATRTRMQMWRLQLFGEAVITLQSLVWPEDMHPAPAVPAPESNARTLKLANEVLDMVTSDFDVANYVDTSRVRRAELLASKAGLVPGQPLVRPVSVIDQLKAEVEANAKPVKRKAPVKKAAAKAPAKRSSGSKPA
jgi:non-homologous end joining protein Ku